MSSYVDNVKRNIAGQGRVSQLRDEDQDPAPVMPPPMKLLPIVTSGGKYDQRPASGLQSASACWACAGCGGRMEPGEVAVFAERAGADKCWHPDCFSCCECGEILEVTRHLPPTQGQLLCFRTSSITTATASSTAAVTSLSRWTSPGAPRVMSSSSQWSSRRRRSGSGI